MPANRPERSHGTPQWRACDDCAADNAANHDQNAGIFQQGNQLPKPLGPGRNTLPLKKVEADPFSQRRGRGDDIGINRSLSDPGNRILAIETGIIPIPVLPLLTEVDGVEQIGAGNGARFASHGAEIRDRERNFRWFGHEEEADRRMRGAGKGFELFQGWRQVALKPTRDFGEFCPQIGQCQSGSLAGPAQDFRIYRDAVHILLSLTNNPVGAPSGAIDRSRLKPLLQGQYYQVPSWAVQSKTSPASPRAFASNGIPDGT